MKDLLTIAVQKDEAKGHEDGVPVEGDPQVCGAPHQPSFEMVHPVYGHDHCQQPYHLQLERGME